VRTSIAPTIRDDVQPQAKALGDPTRFRIFRYVFEAGRPVGVAELTAYTQLNHNAVRQHLAVLTSAGLVVEEVEERSRPGRPRLMYTPAPDVAGLWGTPSPYEYLATLLSEVLRTNARPEEVGRSAGRRRAVELSRRPHGEPLAVLEGEMARIGFRPTVRQRAHSVDLVLGRCPFVSAAAANPGVVCQIHRGLADGLAEGIGGIDVEDLVAKNPHKAGCRLVMHVCEG
jgi:predicted ArsR family transcriptional regulator